MAGKQDPTEKDLLFDLDVVEVSIVPAGENDRRFAVFKSQDGKAPPWLSEDVMKCLMGGGDHPLHKSVAKYVGESGLSPRASAAVGAAFKLLSAVADELPPEVAEEIAMIAAEMGEESVSKAAMTAAARNKLPEGAFAIPEKRAYPIHDLPHARNALARSSGKSEEAKVRAAVYRKWPQLDPSKEKTEKRDMKLPVKKSAAGVDELDLSQLPEQQHEIAKALWDSQTKEREAVQKAASLDEALTQERSAKMSKEFIEKAAKLDKLGVKPEELGPVLKAVADKAPDQLSLVEKILGDANAAVAKAQADAAEAVQKSKTSEEKVAASAAELVEVKKTVGELKEKVEKISTAAPAPKAAGANGTEDPGAGGGDGKTPVTKGKESVFKGVL